MRKILEIKICDDGSASIESEYNPLKGMNLYQQVFLTFLFENNLHEVYRWMEAVRILAYAECAASYRPELAMSMFEHTREDLSGVCAQLKRHLGGNLNFKLATI